MQPLREGENSIVHTDSATLDRRLPNAAGPPFLEPTGRLWHLAPMTIQSVPGSIESAAQVRRRDECHSSGGSISLAAAANATIPSDAPIPILARQETPSDGKLVRGIRTWCTAASVIP